MEAAFCHACLQYNHLAVIWLIYKNPAIMVTSEVSNISADTGLSLEALYTVLMNIHVLLAN